MNDLPWSPTHVLLSRLTIFSSCLFLISPDFVFSFLLIFIYNFFVSAVTPPSSTALYLYSHVSSTFFFIFAIFSYSSSFTYLSFLPLSFFLLPFLYYINIRIVIFFLPSSSSALLYFFFLSLIFSSFFFVLPSFRLALSLILPRLAHRIFHFSLHSSVSIYLHPRCLSLRPPFFFAISSFSPWSRPRPCYILLLYWPSGKLTWPAI